MGKSKIEKDKTHIMNEIADARAATDEVMRAQTSADKSNKNLSANLNNISKKINEANPTLGDFEATKRKIAAENADLIRVVGDLDTNYNMLLKLSLMVPRKLLMKKLPQEEMFYVRFLRLREMPTFGEISMRVKLLPRLKNLK